MARIIVANILTTTTTTANQTIAQYTVPTGKTFTLKLLGLGGEPTTWSTTELSMGYCWVDIGGTDYRGIELRAMQGDATGVNIQYLILPIPNGIQFNAGETIKIECTPTTTTSARWKGIIIGDEA
jgi:hypothetical protein